MRINKTALMKRTLVQPKTLNSGGRPLTRDNNAMEGEDT